MNMVQLNPRRVAHESRFPKALISFKLASNHNEPKIFRVQPKSAVKMDFLPHVYHLVVVPWYLAKVYPHASLP